jgi:hypothetical protein
MSQASFFLTRRLLPFLLGSLGMFFLSFSPAQAVNLASQPFGGRVIFSVPCTCGPYPGSMVNIISGPSWGGWLYAPGLSQLKENFLVNVPGVWLLGSATRVPSLCLIGFPPACIPAPVPVRGTILEVGTSRPGL